MVCCGKVITVVEFELKLMLVVTCIKLWSERFVGSIWWLCMISSLFVKKRSSMFVLRVGV